MTPLLVYITCSAEAEAERIAAALLDRRLVACANIIKAPLRSLYLWQGQREEAEEFLLLCKTMDDRFTELNRVVREIHSYTTPCIVSLPLAAADPDYLAWLLESTRPQQVA